LAMTVFPRSRVLMVAEGNTTAVTDSAAVTLTGLGAAATDWTATHGAAAWVTLADSSGTGSGVVRWTRDPSGLTDGTYVDTITVSAPGASGSPAQLVDTLLVERVLATVTVDPSNRADTLLAGFEDAIADSASVVFTGGGPAVAWTATHGSATWLTLADSSGTDNGVVRWSRAASSLGVGTHVDTISVTAGAAMGSPVSVIVTLEVTDAVALLDAANHLMLGTGLSPFQAAFLDRFGNQDGTFNVGDVLAWVERCQGASPGGCVTSSAEIERTQNVLGVGRDEDSRDAEPDDDGTRRRQP